jgi:hypothetical protein
MTIRFLSSSQGGIYNFWNSVSKNKNKTGRIAQYDQCQVPRATTALRFTEEKRKA